MKRTSYLIEAIVVGIACAVIFLVFGTMANATERHGRCDFPDPGTQIHMFAGTGISFAEYTRSMDLIESVWTPVFEQKNCPLTVVRSWHDGIQNAQAWFEVQDGKMFCFIEMFGGLARHPEMTMDGYTLIANHEIGHLIGGRPYYSDVRMSVEGQADFWATRHGMRRLGIPSKDASMAVARTLADLGGEPMPWRPGPWLPDYNGIMEEHPDAQCRLLSMDAGRLFKRRPKCWYNP